MKKTSPELDAFADYSEVVHTINSASIASTAMLACLIKLAEHHKDSKEYVQEVFKALEAFEKSNDALKLLNSRLANKLSSEPIRA